MSFKTKIGKNALRRVLIGRAALVAGVVAVSMPVVSATGLKLPYASTQYCMGKSASDTAATVTTDWKLAFEGATLEEIQALIDRGYVFGAHMGGSGVSLNTRPHQHSQIQTQTDSETGKPVLISVTFSHTYSGTYAAVVELADGDKGVVARIASRNNNNITIDSLVIVNVPDTDTPTLQWPGATLDEIKDYEFTAYTCGASYNNASTKERDFTGYNTRVTTDGEGHATSIIVEFQHKPGKAMRYVVVEFTNGDGGVYARSLKCGYFDPGTLGAQVVKDGGGYNGNNAGEPLYGLRGAVNGGYGVHSICAAPKQRAYSMAGWFKAKNVSQKVWANADGEDVLTLEDVKDYRFTAIMNGKSIGSDNDMLGYNKTFEYDETGKVKMMSISYQYFNSSKPANKEWIKYENVTFTNGVDGIYGYATGVGYIAGDLGVAPPQEGNYTLATSATAEGYGAYNFVASPGLIQLTEDTDWSARGTIPWDGTVIDLNGHSLTFEGGNMSSVVASPSPTFVNSTAGTAQLHIKVPFGNTFNNNGLVIGLSGRTPATRDAGRMYKGDVKPVKEGGGAYVAACAQYHAAGLEITKGVVKLGIAQTTTPLGPVSQPVIVNAGCALDVNGFFPYGNYSYKLNGGELRNTGSSRDWDKAQIDEVRLTADSSIYFASTYGLVGSGIADTTLDLGGNTLAITVPNSSSRVIFENTTATAGRIVVNGAGMLYVGPPPPPSYGQQAQKKGFQGLETDLELGCGLNMQHWMKIHDYTALYEGSGNLGTGVLEVYGTFKPVGAGFYPPVLQAGASLDLTEWEGALPLAGVSVVDAASASIMLVSLDSESATTKAWARARQQLLAWDDKPENTAFKLDSASAARYRLLADGTGLYLRPKGGFVLIVR